MLSFYSDSDKHVWRNQDLKHRLFKPCFILTNGRYFRESYRRFFDLFVDGRRQSVLQRMVSRDLLLAEVSQAKRGDYTSSYVTLEPANFVG